ncbi:hypothetical protein KY333_00055 [Candidatus Woesearchaeota archaeon]|nr:hypothetical protein [Candidatus Woesearchaeota archaeon]
MKIDILDKMYIVGELKQRGIIVQLDDLDPLKDELTPFAKARLADKQQNGGIPEKELPYAQTMAKYFGIDN